MTIAANLEHTARTLRHGPEGIAPSAHSRNIRPCRDQEAQSALLHRGRVRAHLHAPLLERCPHHVNTLRPHQRTGSGPLEALKMWAELRCPQERLQNLSTVYLEEQHLGQCGATPVLGPALD